MLPMFYNNNVQIVQTRDYVMVESEMIHDARVISLNRRTHLPAQIRQWKGDSIGHWEGDTLVVDTTNFTDKTTIRSITDSLLMIPRPSSGAGRQQARCREPMVACSSIRAMKGTTQSSML
jgi:hypothetical protein